MIKAAIVSIGNEILEGSIVDTNGNYIAKKLSQAGITVTSIQAAPDDLENLTSVLKNVSHNNNVILTTGGLGPTFDDITAQALANAANLRLKLNNKALEHIKKRLDERNVKMKENHKRQAFLPENCILFPNDKGTAYGFGVAINNCIIISMPGIPYEMKHMFDFYVMPFIEKKFDIPKKYFEELRFAGLPESDLDEAINEVGLDKQIDCIINVSSGEIIVRLRSLNKNVLNDTSDKIINKLKKYFISKGNETIEKTLLKILNEKKYTLSVAESCTGGLIGEKITSVPGSSKYFAGGVITYSNEVKINQLKVEKNIIEKFGAVSEECAKQMAFNVSKIFKTEASISVTGIAGPDGGTNEKPVGLVYIGTYLNNKIDVKRFIFRGDREAIRQRSAKTAMNLLIKRISDD
jgi:nicotinamide-nucleotide amidase